MARVWNAGAMGNARGDSNWRAVIGSGRVMLQAEAVADAEHGLDDAGMLGVRFELAAQVLHVAVHDPFRRHLVPADPVQQLESGVQPARNGGERGPDPPLGRRELARFTVASHLV